MFAWLPNDCIRLDVTAVKYAMSCRIHCHLVIYHIVATFLNTLICIVRPILFLELSVEGTDDIWFINFYSPQCSHCHDLAPTVRQLTYRLHLTVSTSLLLMTIINVQQCLFSIANANFQIIQMHRINELQFFVLIHSKFEPDVFHIDINDLGYVCTYMA